MNQIWNHVDWYGMLMPDTPLLEIFLRGSMVYLAIFLMLRFVLKRQAGSMNTGDVLVLVLIADAAQNAMAADYKSVPDGLLLVATIIGWSLALDWLGYQLPWFEKLISPPPLPLVRRGRMLRQNMRRELITAEDLMGQLRLEGIEDIANVKKACLESDGKFSVIKFKD